MRKIIALFLILFILCPAAELYAKGPTALNLEQLLGKITKPGSTSLQKSDAMDSYKGKIIRGSGVVRDVLRSYGSDNEAMVYLDKAFRGRKYEIVLAVNRDDAEKIIKKKTVSFKGEFSGMSFGTLRFKNAEVKRLWWWPF